jgi:FixJ family two-component response regulator
MRLKGLTPREREVAQLVERNHSNDEIARALDITRGTKVHVHNIMIKSGLTPRARGTSKRGAITAEGRKRIGKAQRRRWQRWRQKAART